jgi:very-short-patch-repair endonuclease
MGDYRDGEVSPHLLRFSREPRRGQTNAEQRLWWLLRARQVAGAKFRRQHPFGPYVLDFLCAERGLVVELDGDQHALPREVTRDAVRTHFLRSHGLRVLRFSNHEVLRETEAVLQRIYTVLSQLPSP